jgi:hypothetical protein
MLSSLPVQVWLIAILSLIGVMVVVRKARTFAGYKEIARDVRRIAADFGSKPVRVGEDLVVSGNRNGVPTFLRFFRSEGVPASVVQCNAPVNFRLLLARRGKRFTGEGALIRLNNPRLDRVLCCHSIDPVQCNIFLGFPEVQTELEKLCWSSNTLLRFSEGKIELTEFAIPLNLTEHLLNQCEPIADLAQLCGKMPNAGQISVQSIPEQKKAWVPRAALAAAVIICFAIIPFRSQKVEGASTAGLRHAVGIDADDFKRIPGVRNWRLGTNEDMDAAFAAWIDPSGSTLHTRLSLDANGRHESTDNAYLLASDKSNTIRRVVWVADRHVVYDFVGTLIGIARVPRDEVQHMRWSESGTPQESPDGDGLLVVREYGNADGASIFFLHNGVLCSGIPANYRNLSLK